MMIGRRASGLEKPVSLATTAHPSPNNCGMHPSLPLPPPPQASTAECGCWWRGRRAGETTPSVGAVAMNVNDTCFPWSVVLQSVVTSLVLVCIYVAP